MDRYDLAAVRARLEGRAPLNRASDQEGKHAAVAIILAPRGPDEDAQVLFIKRAERESDPWSGHIAFPGGRGEPSDTSLLETAIRETREEVGLDLAGRASVIARMEDIPATARSRRLGLSVTPFVFALHASAPTLSPNEEVATTLWVPLGQLARYEGASTMTYNYEGNLIQLPCVKLGEHVLWGLSYRMVILLLDALK